MERNLELFNELSKDLSAEEKLVFEKLVTAWEKREAGEEVDLAVMITNRSERSPGLAAFSQYMTEMALAVFSDWVVNPAEPESLDDVTKELTDE